MAWTNVHPFPARMASDIALAKVKTLKRNSIVLDPMMGSGTVLLAASSAGHQCIGFDLDPLSILISKVATRRLNEDRFATLLELLLKKAQKIDLRNSKLPWADEETEAFIEYWFAGEQRRALTRLALVIHNAPSFCDGSPEADAIRLAISKLIITKESGASLARDISHSRPHRVADTNDFDVFEQLKISAVRLQQRIAKSQLGPRPKIRMADARAMPWVRDKSVDMILTSPPYLNAIDYMRGHRLSLVWLGYNLRSLRNIRSNSIGAERAADATTNVEDINRIRKALGEVDRMSSRHQNMINRYCTDLILVAKQTSRVLKKSGKAVFVVGNSCLKDTYISNSRGLEVAAQMSGLQLIERKQRKLPNQNRYLPMPNSGSALSRRMRVETVLTFEHA